MRSKLGWYLDSTTADVLGALIGNTLDRYCFSQVREHIEAAVLSSFERNAGQPAVLSELVRQHTCLMRTLAHGIDAPGSPAGY